MVLAGDWEIRIVAHDDALVAVDYLNRDTIQPGAVHSWMSPQLGGGFADRATGCWWQPTYFERGDIALWRESSNRYLLAAVDTAVPWSSSRTRTKRKKTGVIDAAVDEVAVADCVDRCWPR